MTTIFSRESGIHDEILTWHPSYMSRTIANNHAETRKTYCALYQSPPPTSPTTI
jgi:hypothetical protein